MISTRMGRIGRAERIGALALLFGLMACGGVANPSGVPDPESHRGTVDIAIGESTQVDGVEIGFVAVTADSRCPTDVVCVWAGNAAVELRVSRDGSPEETIELNSTVEPRSIEWNGVLLRLVEVRPEPISTQSIDPGDYSVRVEVSFLDKG